MMTGHWLVEWRQNRVQSSQNLVRNESSCCSTGSVTFSKLSHCCSSSLFFKYHPTIYENSHIMTRSIQSRLEPDALITLVLKVGTPHNQIESESAVHHCTAIAFTNTFFPLAEAVIRQTETLQSVYLPIPSLLDRYFGKAVSPSMHHKWSDSQSPRFEFSKVQRVYKCPCAIFCSTLLLVLNWTTWGKVWGVIPWSQKSFKICVPVPISLRVVQ